jgi:hypothetical protein
MWILESGKHIEQQIDSPEPNALIAYQNKAYFEGCYVEMPSLIHH